MDINLKQRGRSSIDFAADLTGSTAKLAQSVNTQLSTLSLPDDISARGTQINEFLRGNNPNWFARRMGKWSSVTHGDITGDAFAEIQHELEPKFDELRNGPTQIEANPNCEYPDYWVGVDFHCTTGGWVREHQGFIHGELIHPLYVGKNYPGNIFQQRRDVLGELGGRTFERILEMGTSSGHYTLQLAAEYPQASITGVELGLPMLEQAQRFANERGLSWRLIQAPAEKTGLPDASFDLVTSYILLHELPASANKAVFEEAYRLLEPGGAVLMTDVRPFRDMTRLEEWQAIDMTKRAGEPYWEEAASLDLAELASNIGFVNAKSYGLGERGYPWVTIAYKPE